MEQGILSTPANVSEVADFLLENPRLSKAKIGEYIGERKNAHILEAFVRYTYMSIYRSVCACVVGVCVCVCVRKCVHMSDYMYIHVCRNCVSMTVSYI